MDLARISQEQLNSVNVKTHYNNNKGDVMFTCYYGDKSWNLCFNERQNLWVTRYSWIPLLSTNIDNRFYSFKLNDDTNPMELWKSDYNCDPTKWYGEQEPFEFQFIVTEPEGIHKIFENLHIISNNVQPIEVEYELIGDAYLFSKERLFYQPNESDKKNIAEKPDGGTKDYEVKQSVSDLFKSDTNVEFDTMLNEHVLKHIQKCYNKDKYGIIKGNIQYKEDGWYLNIEPIIYDLAINKIDPTKEIEPSNKYGSAKLKDKWLRVKIKYSGDQLAIINAVSTTENISYA